MVEKVAEVVSETENATFDSGALFIEIIFLFANPGNT